MKEQEGFYDSSIFAARLREERRRVAPHQGDFARVIGLSQGSQSLLERGERELRAGYLERIAREGIDVYFVITGRRCADHLDDETTELVSIFLSMPQDMRLALLTLGRSMAGYIDTHPATGHESARATVHDRGLGFRGEDDG